MIHLDLYVKIVGLWLERGVKLTIEEEQTYESQKLGSQDEKHFKTLLETFCPDWWTPI